MEEDELEVIDSENYRGGGKDEPLSHSQLVAIAMKKCLDARAKEMREGYTTIKRDKFGNQLPIYIPDTRKEFIECIEALKMVMGVDLDDDASKRIEKIDQDLKKKFEEYIKLEENEWLNANPMIRKEWSRLGRVHMQGKLSQGLSYFNEYLLDKVLAYTQIYIEFDKRAKELGYFKEEEWEA
jgi:hypothetical protein